MRHPRLAAAVVVLAAALLPTATAAGQAPPAACADARLAPRANDAANDLRVDTAVICLVNRQRARIGLKPLQPEARLAFAATAFAGQMVRQGFFDHTAPDGATMLDRVRPTGYVDGLKRYRLAETISWGTGGKATPAGILAQWMASPPHRAALMDPRLEEIGVGVVTGAPVAGAEPANAATYAAELGRRR